MSRMEAASYGILWIKFVLLSAVICVFSTKYSNGESCPAIVNEARVTCHINEGSQSKTLCESAGCCWDEKDDNPETKCYERECKSGYFGWRCKFRCHCDGDASCNRYTGECEFGCPPDRWGIGCLLESTCTYNDPSGLYYTGKKSRTDGNRSCVNWSLQKAYPAAQFPDKDIAEAGNYCRNPKPPETKTWCYWRLVGGSQRRWGYCTLQNCSCPVGRFGINCVSECHCRNGDNCNQVTGVCSSGGCDPHWMGSNCQECADSRFGVTCESKCHCNSPQEVCEKGTGHCESGCAAGWQGTDCQTECQDGRYGLNCESDCNCKIDHEVCNKSSGFCKSGCKLGYAGESCMIQLPVMTKIPDLETRNATSITIRWREWRNPPDRGSGPVSDYIVYYKARNETDWFALNRSNFRSASVANLQPMQSYQFRVAAVHLMGFVGPPSSALTIITCGRPLSGPLNVRNRVSNPAVVSGSTDEVEDYDGEFTESADAKERISITVDWKLPSRDKYNCVNLRQYRVYKKGPDNDGLVFLQNVDLHRITINDIDPYSNLTIGVSLVNNAGLESDVIETVYVGKSGPVEHFQLTARSSSVLFLQWDPPLNSNSQVQYYVVTYRGIRSGSCSVQPEPWSPLMDVESDKTELELPDLTSYTKYQVRIWPHTEAGKGQELVMSATTEPAAPSEISQFERIGLSAVTAKFLWNEIECRKWNGVASGYAFQLLMQRQDTETVVRQSIINDTELELRNLVPYTNYSIELWSVNHRFPGPKTRIDFMTYEGVPPAPTNVAVIQSLSESISISWDAPDPPHGIIIGYVIKYSGQKLQQNTVYSDAGPELRQYNMTLLEPNNTYSIQVRAFTKAGESRWSDMIEGFTDQSVPGEPRNLRNVSRSVRTVKLQWEMPMRPNGLLTQYKITCSPVSTSGKPLSEVVRYVDPQTLDCIFDDLKPGVNYICSALAATIKGYGPAATCLFWTEPEISVVLPAPRIESNKVTDTSVAIFLPEMPTVEYMDEADRLYRVVVEKRADGNRRLYRDVENSRMPCGMSHSEISDYTRANSRSVACYVAAEFPVVPDRQPFVVGDNKTYGGYYNGPLDKNVNYFIWFGIVVIVDGVTSSSYSKTEINRTPIAQAIPEKDADSKHENAAMTGAIIGALAAIVVIIAIAAIIIYKILRRKKENGRANGNSNSDTDNRGTEGKSLIGDENEPSTHRESEKIHKPIDVEDLWNYVTTMKMFPGNGLKEEYEELDQKFMFKHEVAKKPENKLKNRYGNIVAYDHSRVVLECLPDDPHSDYINANYIDSYKKPKAYVAAQGPNKVTLNDIWRMTWQLRSTRIIMVANLMEDGRHKCEQYWPEAENTKSYGDILVTMIELEHFADFKIRTFTMTKGGETRTVRQFHFTAWPDHGVPTYPTCLLAFRKKVRYYDDPSVGPTIVHCSAGVGRSGTFIALDYLLDQAKDEGKVDIFNCVKQMRTNRVNMVQTLEQYIFVYDALLEALKSGDTSIPCVDFQPRYASLQTINPLTRQSFLKDEYDLLGTMVLPSPTDTLNRMDALSPENINKNRVIEIIPVSRLSRPYLRSYISGSSDYINAVYTDGYKQRDAFIITQTPLPITVADIWTMIVDHSCHTIISLDDWDPMDPTVGHYFPLQAGSLTFGPFTVDMVTVDESNESYTVRDFTITSSKRADSSSPVFVRHFQYKGWPKNEVLPTKSSMIALLIALEKWQQRSGNTVIVVHCMDGATRSGLLCAVNYMVERLKVEQDVDVFQSVKHTRINRSQLIPQYEQYQFLYEMAVEYMACFETYSNFK